MSSSLTKEVERLLDRIDRSDPGDLLFGLTELAEHVAISCAARASDLPMELGDAIAGIDERELAVAAALRSLTPADLERGGETRVRANLLRLIACGRKRRFQDLRAVWLENLGEGD